MITGYTTKKEFAVPFPKLSDEQVEWFIQQVLAYIDRQRQTYRDKEVPLDTTQLAIMRPFFPALALNSTRVVTLAPERVGNPPFYGRTRENRFQGWLAAGVCRDSRNPQLFMSLLRAGV
jgi:hypothetical protein